jgi:hypothetical protein|eukprot:COSAG01_NODE_9164_length_2532_cov_1.403617_2_plen_41_part_00
MQIVELVDLFKTLCELADVPLPAHDTYHLHVISILTGILT